MPQLPEFETENEDGDLYEYEGDKKIYLGHFDQWYFENYNDQLNRGTAIIMLTDAIRRYVLHAQEIGCEPVTKEWADGVLDHLFNGEGNEDDNENVFEEILTASGMWN